MKRPQVMLIVNIGIYQIIWFSCVMGETMGALLSLPLLALHLYLTPHPKEDLQLMAGLGLTGVLADGSLQHLGVLTFKGAGMVIPFWLMVIWVALATLPHHSLGWLKGRFLLSGLLGGMAGPLAYWAGVRTGAAAFAMDSLGALLILAVLWAAIWSMTMFFATRKMPRVSPPIVGGQPSNTD